MIRTKSRFICMATLLLVLALPFAAMAHKVNIFAYVEGNTIFTESYFPDGTPVVEGRVLVRDSHNQGLVEGKTDSDGLFSFPVPAVDDLTIVIEASMGHRNQFVLKKAELEE